MSLEYLSPEHVEPLREEEYFSYALSIRDKSIVKSIEEADILNSIGRGDNVKDKYSTIFYYAMIRDFLWDVNTYYETYAIKNALECPGNTIENIYKISCIRKSLTCKIKGADLVGYFDKLMSYLNLDRRISVCKDLNYRAGIGVMQIEGTNPITVNKVG